MPKLVGTKAVINIVKLVLIFSLIVFPVVTSSSCKSAEIVTGSGNRITESRDLESFEKVELTAHGKLVIEQWRREYNEVRPHSALGYRPPTPKAKMSLTLT